MSHSLWPHRWQPTRLPHPWDSPGKNTGLPFPSPMHESESEVAQSCPALRDPMDCSLPDSSVHGILQARVLEWVSSAFSTYLLKFIYYTLSWFFLELWDPQEYTICLINCWYCIFSACLFSRPQQVRISNKAEFLLDFMKYSVAKNHLSLNSHNLHIVYVLHCQRRHLWFLHCW